MAVVTESASHSLFRVREAKGISQARMAELLGLTPFTYYAFERGRRVPSPARWQVLKARLARVMDATVPGPRKHERCPVRTAPEGFYPADTVFAVWPKRALGRDRGRIASGTIYAPNMVGLCWLRVSDITPRGPLPMLEAFDSFDDVKVRLLGADVEITWRA